MKFDIDVCIFLTYLVLNLVVGLMYGRNVKTIQDYALGGRNFTTGALVATIVGTWASGSGFFITLSKVYSDGIFYVIAYNFWVCQLLLIAFIFAPRMGEFLGKMSIAEAMGDLYNKHVRLVVAIAGTFSAVGIIAVQFKACGYIFGYFLGVDSAVAVISVGIVVTIYSAFGGIRAITFADILQCITFGVAIPLVGVLIWHALNHTTGFSFEAAMQNPKFNISHALDWRNPELWQMLPLMLYFMVPSLEPAFAQRIMIGSSLKQIQKAFVISAGLLFFIKLATAWIPFLLFSVDSTLDPGQLLPYIIDSYSYTGLKGLIIIGIMALAMSTADAHMNSASVLFAHDICAELNIGFIKELLVSRLFAIFLGIAGIVLALSKTDILSIVLAAQSFYMPVVTVPLIMTILGFRSSAFSVLTGMAAGFVTVVIWKIIGIKMECIVIAMCVNLLFLVGSHYIFRQKGGFVGVKDRTLLDQKIQKRMLWKNNIRRQIRDFNLFNFIKKFAPTNELMYSGFGIYCIIYTIVTMYIADSAFANDSTRTLMHFFQLMLVTGTMIGSYPIWPASIKKELIVQIWWPIAVFYMLGFFSAFFLMVAHFEGLAFSVFTVNAVVAFTIVGWRMGSLMLIFGFYLASIMYQNYAPIHGIELTEVHSTASIFMYLLLLLGAAVVIFFKPKEDVTSLLFEKIRYLEDTLGFQKNELVILLGMKNEFLRNIEHESNTPITGITSMAQALEYGYEKLSDNQIKGGIHDIVTSSERLHSWASNLVDLSRLSAQGKDNILKEEVDLSDLIEERLNICQKLYIEKSQQDNYNFVLNLGDHITVLCNKYYISRVIDNLIINAIQYAKGGKIELTLRDINEAGHKIKFYIADEGVGIPLAELYNIFGLLTVSSKTRSNAGGRGVGLTLCKKIVELHNGRIWAESDGVKGSKFLFVL
ncbi:MAG: ATP-binding protein [Pseudomonadota bacterium]